MLGFIAPRPRPRRAAIALVALGLAIGGTAPVGAAPPAGSEEIRTTVLPHLDPALPISRPYDINNRGQVVGISSSRPVLWQAAAPMDLALSAPLPPATSFDVEFVNDRGQVGVDLGSHAALWNRGRLIDIDGDASSSSVHGLNERGQALVWDNSGSRDALRLWDQGRLVEVVGAEEGTVLARWDLSEGGHVVFNQRRSCAGCQSGPYLWHEGTLAPVAPLEWAYAVNRSGQVAGWVPTGDGGFHAAVWDHGEVTDLGTLGGSESWAVDINDRGQVIGASRTAEGELRPFLWEDGEMTALGTLGGPAIRAEMINQRGQVALQGDAPDGSSHAAVWDDGELIDLGEVHTAHDPVLNERDQAIGYRPDGTAVIWHLP